MEILSTVASTLLSVALRSDVFSSTQQVEAVGTYKFTPAISQLEACRQAENRAKQIILEKTQGATFASDQAQQCIENDDSLQCKQHTVTVQSSRGVISEIVSRDENVVDWTCSVRLVAKVKRSNDTIDPNFDINVKINRTMFEDGDSLSFDVDANASGFLTVFHYQPDTQNVVKIFPNKFQPINQIDKGLGVLAPSADYKFKMTAKTVGHTSEYLYFVYTENEVNFFQSYTLQKFIGSVDNINGKKRLVKKGFVISKGEI